MDCPSTTGHDVAEAYVLGTLPEADADAFEQHFFTCAACLAQVQLLQDARDRLASVPSVQRSPDARLKATPWIGLAAAAALVAALGWWWQRGPVGPAAPPIAATGLPAAGPIEPVPSAKPSVAETPVEAPTRRTILAQLALVVPPRYVPIAVRGGEAPAAGSFDAAMAHYVAGRHDEAARALQALSEAQPTDPGIAFFWGISELVRGRIEPAREGLTRAISADVQPYADEAHFYVAKLYLAEGDVDMARMELKYAIEHEAGPEGEAQRILAALDRLPAQQAPEPRDR